MCFTFFKKVKPPNWEYNNKIALLFAINDYKGYSNDLRGCINDIKLAQNRIPKDFQIREFVDKQVTRSNFINQTEYALVRAQPDDVIYIHYSGHGTYVKDHSGDEWDGYDEALYLYDGPLIDDDINAVLQLTPEGVEVIVVFDSCYSGTATRSFHKSRFLQYEKEPIEMKPRKRTLHKHYENMKWVAISACGEHQTAADAFIDGAYYGGLSYFLYHCLHLGMTYRQWHAKIREFLPSQMFEQAPEIEGPIRLVDKPAFGYEKNE